MTINLQLSQIVGKAFHKGWRKKVRYRLFKGARNSGKSYNIIGLEVIYNIIASPLENILIVRQVETSHTITTWNSVISAINMPDIKQPELSFNKYFKINKVEKIITYIPTGQVIVFRGFDKAEKLTGLKAQVGFFTKVYIEEAFEIKDYDEFRKLDGSLRGKLPDGLYHQITFLFNAWNKEHWLYEKFFKDRLEDDFDRLELNDYIDYYDPNYVGDYGLGLYLHISTYKANEFRDMATYDIAMANLREKAIEIYKVEALGMWGYSGEVVYPEWNDSLIANPQIIAKTPFVRYAIGIDTGLSESKDTQGVRSATTMVLAGLTYDREKIIAVNEYFHSNAVVKKTEPEIMEEIIDKIIEWKDLYYSHQQLMKGTILVYVDNADIGFRQGLDLVAKRRGIFNIVFQGSTKLKIQTRVDFNRLLMAYGDYLVSTMCPNLIREHKSARRGAKTVREDFNDHTMNAMEYAWASVVIELRKWATFKER